jgi:uncharacterized protein
LETTSSSHLIIPGPVVTEVCYLLSSRLGPAAEAAFLADLASGEPFEVAAPTLADYARMSELVSTYANVNLGVADASVITLAERLDTATIATVDRKDFQIIRPRHVPFFTLVPDLDP